MDEQKTCKECNQTKPISDFVKQRCVCRECRTEKQRAKRNNNLNLYRGLTNKYNRQRKEKVISKYSNGEMCCGHCGYSDIRALTIDHIAGDGHKHKGKHNYRYYLKNDVEGLQVLCMNCNFIKRYENQEFGERIKPDHTTIKS